MDAVDMVIAAMNKPKVEPVYDLIPETCWLCGGNNPQCGRCGGSGTIYVLKELK